MRLSRRMSSNEGSGRWNMCSGQLPLPYCGHAHCFYPLRIESTLRESNIGAGFDDSREARDRGELREKSPSHPSFLSFSPRMKGLRNFKEMLRSLH